MRLLNIILLLFISIQLYGQNNVYYKTASKRNLHYLVLNLDKIIVYKMGSYFDKSSAGSGSAIVLTDTLFKNADNTFNGSFYAIYIIGTNYYLIAFKDKKPEVLIEENKEKVITELNNAYCLKRYFELSRVLNSKFQLYHYSFREAYSIWSNKTNKTIDHNYFSSQIDNEIKLVFDSISLKQNTFTNTTNFIINNVKQVTYSKLLDSIKTLPIDWRPNLGYFDRAVYQITKSNPEYFYKLLQDFPKSKIYIYSAVDQDKELVMQLKKIQGYDDIKSEFFKDYKYGKSMPYRIFGLYAILGGLATWLLISQI